MNNSLLAAMLPGMHFFLCAAQLRSFTKAAKELCVTQGAVSHRIRQLEEQLGFPLFHRFPRKIMLTGEGERLYHILSGPMWDLENEIRRIRHLGLTGSLMLHCPPSMAGIWLMPRLVRFQALHPGIDVHVRCRNDLVDFEQDTVDIALTYGSGLYPGLHVRPLMRERLMPVCAPDYAARHDFRNKGAMALAGCTLLHDNMPWPNAQYFSEWQAWAGHMGLAGLDVCRGYSFDRSELALLAAEKGLGVAMGRGQLVRDALVAGRLSAPLPEEMEAPQAYYAVVRREDAERPRIHAFLHWLLAETLQPGH